MCSVLYTVLLYSVYCILCTVQYARTVEAEVLREGLRDERLEAASDEVARGGRVGVRVARREALIREVDHREQLALLRARRIQRAMCKYL